MEANYQLYGTWQFQADESMEGKGLGYENCDLNDDIQLPGTTALAKKGVINKKKESGFLTELYPYSGYAWYSKIIEIQDREVGKTAILTLERSRITTVYIDGVCAGTCNSLTTAHVYDLTELIHQKKFRLTILVSNTGYPTAGGHLTSPDTQTNWNGILGKMELAFHDSIYLQNVRADADVCSKAFCLACTFKSLEKKTTKQTLMVTAKEIWLLPEWEKQKGSQKAQEKNSMLPGDVEDIVCEREVLSPQIFELKVEPGVSVSEITYQLGNEAKLWNEYTPVLYELTAELKESGEKIKVITGLRSFKRDTHYFLVNGQRIFLRGKHDAMVFPETGAAPMDVKEWLNVMAIAKSYGINHYRFHTCCPPEAAFEAADLLGIYLQPELPFWGTLAAPGEEGYKEEEEKYLIEEGFRILEAYGNHPSFCMMSLGNELWGSAKRMGEIIKGYQSVDRRHLYAQGSNNFQFYPEFIPEEDFWSGVRLESEKEGVNQRLIRGSFAACDAPQGYIQTEEPSTMHDYQLAICPEGNPKGKNCLKVPLVVHEAGQYAVYPDDTEIEKYKGPLRARNFELFRERLAEKGMLHLAHDLFWNSGKLSAACYKEEVEAFLRTDLLAGFQLLDLQDYPGQGTALVGILNAFMENKGYCSREEWCEFCSDLVILAKFPGYLYEAGQEFKADILLSNHRFNKKMIQGKIRYRLAFDTGEVIAEGTLSIPETNLGLNKVGNLKIALPKVTAPHKIELSFAGYEMENTTPWNTNHYSLWIYPENKELTEQVANRKIVLENNKEVFLTTKEAETQKLLQEGKRVIYFPEHLTAYIPGTYCTDFWCYPMFRSIAEENKKDVPVGTMGLRICNTHAALNEFPCETYTTPQWYAIISNAKCAILEKETPIAQMIDNFERNHKLGILYEEKTEHGKMLVCTSQLLDLTSRPEVRQFLKSITDYAASEEFVRTAQQIK